MTRRLTVLLIAVATALSLLAAPALAGSMYLAKSNGKAAQTWWTQVDGVDPGTSPFGNVHVGSLYVYETTAGRADAFGYIDDFDCEPGNLPGGGGHEFEEEPSGCAYVGSRVAEGFGLAFTIDRKLNSAHLKGRMTVYGGGHGDGGVVGRPKADITWTGSGSTVRSTSTWTYSDGSTTYTDRWRSTDRFAAMSGTLGPMGFDPELSGGHMSIFRSMSKGRTR